MFIVIDRMLRLGFMVINLLLSIGFMVIELFKLLMVMGLLLLQFEW